MDLVGGINAVEAVATLTDTIETLDNAKHMLVDIEGIDGHHADPNRSTHTPIVYVSAGHALLERIVRVNRPDQLECVDMRLIDQIGRAHVNPAAWDGPTTRAKYQCLVSLLAQRLDDDNDDNEIIDSGMDMFKELFSLAVGGQNIQEQIAKKYWKEVRPVS
jgi:hypothetical protein